MREIRSSGTVRGGDGNVPTYSAQCVDAHAELAGIVGHDHRPGRAKRCVRGQQAMVADRTPERAFSGDLHGIGRDRELVNAEPGQVR